MRTPTALLIALVSTLTFAGCVGSGSGGGDGRDGDGGVGPGPTPANGYTADDAIVERTVRRAVDVGCGRLFGECSHVCDQPFAACGPDATRCAEDFVRATLDDFDDPVADPSLLGRCIDEVRAAACVDLPPSTVACDQLVVEGCPGDADALGAPYSFLRAVDGALPGEVEMYLCDGATEWLALELARGDAVEVGFVGAAPSIGHVEVELYAAPAEPDDAPFDLQRKVLRRDDERETFDPVDAAGRYLLAVELDGQPTAEIVFTAQVAAPPPE